MHFRYFNPVQSESFPAAYLSDCNMLVSAPTGSGKTGVMELAMLRLMARHLDPQTGNLRPMAGSYKVGRFARRPQAMEQLLAITTHYAALHACSTFSASDHVFAILIMQI